MLQLNIGQRVILPKLTGEFMRPRPGTVIDDCDQFYLIKLDVGYKECVLKTDDKGLTICRKR